MVRAVGSVVSALLGVGRRLDCRRVRTAEDRRGHSAPVLDTSSLSTVRSWGLLLPVLI